MFRNVLWTLWVIDDSFVLCHGQGEDRIGGQDGEPGQRRLAQPEKGVQADDSIGAGQQRVDV
jgi:hypothetical protein